MNPHLRRFKEIAAQVAHRCGLRFSLLNTTYGLSDFLIDQVTDSDTPADIAAKALQHFCIEEGEFNGFLPGVQIAVQFLTESYSDFPPHQCLADLRAILEAGGDEGAIRQWVR